MNTAKKDAQIAAWQELASHPYNISAWAYFNRSYNLLSKATEDRTVLFYCALELRCAIERVLYEYLSHIRGGKLTKNESKLWSAKDLKSAVLKLDPDFVEKIEFLNLLLEADGSDHRLTIPDLNRLSTHYGRLNDYLHAQNDPASTTTHPDWWAGFRALIEELHHYAWAYCSETRTRVKLNEVAYGIFEDFKSGRKTRDQTLVALKHLPEGFEADVRLHNYLH